MLNGLLIALLGAIALTACDVSQIPGAIDKAAQDRAQPAGGFSPQVVVAISDSGVNPYHELYYRPDLTEHPCTYVEGYDCSVPALPLSIGQHATWQEAFEADRALWNSIEPHQWYWIPKTNIIGAVCQSTNTGGPICILDDVEPHGTSTSSSVLMEAPETLLLIHEGDASADDLAAPPVIPDVQSHSWAPPVPLPLHALVIPYETTDHCSLGWFFGETLFFLAAGNEALFPAPLDIQRFCPTAIVIGGGSEQAGQIGSWTIYDFVSWHCRPVAKTNSLSEYTEDCGTSFSAPTAAGTAAAALLEIRRRENYTGRSTKDMVSGAVSREAFVNAMRYAATYSPKATYSPGPGAIAPIPLVPGKEYLIWGWGFLDQQVIPVLVACALGEGCPEKSIDAVQWNEAREQVREEGWSALSMQESQ